MTLRQRHRRLVALAGGALALGAGYLFVRHVLGDLSITVRAALLLGLAVVCLCWTAAVTGRRRELPAVGAVAVLLATLFYSAIQFRVPPPTLAVLSLGAFVGLAVFAIYVQDGRLAMSRSAAVYAVIGVLVLAGGFVAVDLAASDVVYTATLDDAATLGNDSKNATRVQFGNATATNTFLFREPVDFPEARACIYTGVGRTDVPVQYGEDRWSYHVSVAAGERIETPMAGRVRPETATAVAGPISIERAPSCPPAGDGPPRVVIAGGPPNPDAVTNRATG